jgi:hypothetical protein
MAFYAWYSQKQANLYAKSNGRFRPVVWVRENGEEVEVTEITDTPDALHRGLDDFEFRGEGHHYSRPAEGWE